MKIHNLTESFIEHVLDGDDQQTYENKYPALFAHYYRFWSPRRTFDRSLTEAWVRERTQEIIKRYGTIEQKFAESSFDISSLEMVLFVGHGTTNGHAFRDGERTVVWIPVETYTSPLLIDVFLTHEIVHGLHYQYSPGFYFRTSDEQKLCSRQLITEGVATLLSQEILGIDELTALWADFLSEADTAAWYARCQEEERGLSRFLLQNFSSSSSDIKLFLAADPDDIYAYRGGYYLGMKIIRQVKETAGIDSHELLRLDADTLTAMARQQVERLASGK